MSDRRVLRTGPTGRSAEAAFAGQANLRPSFVDCSVVCPTQFGPCLSQHVTCAAICTRFTPCLPTQLEPQCPYPTEICTHAAGCLTIAVSCNPACQVTNALGMPAGQSGVSAAEPGVRRIPGAAGDRRSGRSGAGVFAGELFDGILHAAGVLQRDGLYPLPLVADAPRGAPLAP